MSKEINNETIKDFLIKEIDNYVDDFGYLVVPDDERLNSEAMYILKKKFNDFINKD